MAGTLASAARPDHQLARCPLFTGLSPEQLARVAALITPRLLEPGAQLVREGEEASELFVIQQGSVEVIKRVAAGDHDQRIATLREGATLGEMTLVDRAPRSATVRALVPTIVGVLSMDRLERLAAHDREIERRMLRNLANELSRRLRFTNETTVSALQRRLELERTRALMGRFVVLMVFMMVTYIFILRLAKDVLPAQVTPSAITIPIILLWSGALYVSMRRSGQPFEFFGLTLRNWRPGLPEVLVWTWVTCVAATCFKMGLIWGTASFADQRLFNLSGILDPRTTSQDLQASLVLAILYGIAAPLQEFIVRAGLQTGIQHCLVGPSAAVRAIVISNALFASAHMHLSVSFAIFAFFPGLLWGTLFFRQRNIVGVSISHILCGWFAFLVLGFEPWY